MTWTAFAEQQISKILSRGTYGWFPSEVKSVVHMDADEELSRFTQFREQCRTPLPWKIDDWDDRFPYDELEAEKILEDLSLRKRQPAEGFWFDSSVCQMCGSDARDLVQDHCHLTGLCRGLLCRQCNQREGLDDDPKWRLWRLAAPQLERPNRLIYRYECEDCDKETLLTIPFPALYDYHRWVAAENYWMIQDLGMRALRGRKEGDL